MLIRADYRNVADYLAGLGFLELASWFRSGLCARWTDTGIEIDRADEELFHNVVQCCATAEVTLDDAACQPEPPKASPLLLKIAGRELPVNAWLDARLDRKSIWSPGVSGRVSAIIILENLLHHLEAVSVKARPELIFGIYGGFAINDCAQFRFDGTTAWTTLDTGFSPKDAGIKIAARPFVEFLAIIGAQSHFPQADPTKRHAPQYCVWYDYLPISLCRLAARGVLPVRLRHLRGEWLEAGNFGAFTFAGES